MFDKLFSYPKVVRRHQEGPLAAERASYLQTVAARGAPRSTLLTRANYCLCFAQELQKWPRSHRFNDDEVEAMVSSWAKERVAVGRAHGVKWPTHNLHYIAVDFLKAMNRFSPPPDPPAGRFDDIVEDFIRRQEEERFLSPATCQKQRWQIRRFASYLEQQGCTLGGITSDHIDTYFQNAAQKWGRASLCTAGGAIRQWLRYCEAKGWVRRGLSSVIMLPRIYRHEGLPLGPTWEQIRQVIGRTNGEKSLQIRNKAILTLLAVYGLRSGELRNLRLDDIDWQREQVRVARSKSGRRQVLPLEVSVGNAIARYLRHARPHSRSRTLFLTVRAPYRPLSTGALYDLVKSAFAKVGGPRKGRGPHGLRHACARHLTASGFGLKEVGDHLGHRSPDTTALYSKVDLKALRLVALDDLGGLV